jgi:uncharacterized protein (TIGR02996 family)
MTTQAALLREAIENPQDDAPRQILADWLDDHGQHDRAELIRVHLAMARLDTHEPQLAELRRREEALRRRPREAALHKQPEGDAWFGDLPLWGRVWVSRGLLGFQTSAHALAERTSLPAVWEWVEEVALTNALAKTLAPLRESPALASVAALDLSKNTLNLAGARALCDVPCLANLRSLKLKECNVGNKGAIALAASPLFANLRALDLERNLLGPAGVQAVAESPHLARLESLALEWNSAGWVGLSALLSSKTLTRLRSLNLTYNSHGGAPKGIGPLPCDREPSLTTLIVRGNHLGPRGCAALVASPLLAKLMRLDLSLNDARPDGTIAVANSPHLANLTSLDLSYCYPSNEGIAALTQSPYLTKLTELNLSHYYSPTLTPTAVRTLAQWSGLARLRKLALNVEDEGAAILAASPYLIGLRELSLATGYVGDAGAVALATSPHLAGLTRLDLHSNRIGAAGARSLADPANLPNLRSLNVEGNQIDEGCIALLTKRFGQLGQQSSHWFGE